eukprot:PhF_6_TR2257/c0_g1_i1/m.3866
MTHTKKAHTAAPLPSLPDWVCDAIQACEDTPQCDVCIAAAGDSLTSMADVLPPPRNSDPAASSLHIAVTAIHLMSGAFSGAIVWNHPGRTLWVKGLAENCSLMSTANVQPVIQCLAGTVVLENVELRHLNAGKVLVVNGSEAIGICRNVKLVSFGCADVVEVQNGAHTHLQNCQILHGTQMHGSPMVSYGAVVKEGSTFDAFGCKFLGLFGHGMLYDGSSTGTVSDCLLTRCRGRAIDVQGMATPMFVKCLIEENEDGGVRFGQTSGARLLESTITCNSGSSGVEVCDGAEAVIEYCAIKNNVTRQQVLLSTSSTVIMRDNIITGPSGCGVWCSTSASDLIRNDFRGSRIGVLLCQAHPIPNLEANTFAFTHADCVGIVIVMQDGQSAPITSITSKNKFTLFPAGQRVSQTSLMEAEHTLTTMFRHKHSQQHGGDEEEKSPLRSARNPSGNQEVIKLRHQVKALRNKVFDLERKVKRDEEDPPLLNYGVPAPAPVPAPPRQPPQTSRRPSSANSGIIRGERYNWDKQKMRDFLQMKCPLTDVRTPRDGPSTDEELMNRLYHQPVQKHRAFAEKVRSSYVRNIRQLTAAEQKSSVQHLYYNSVSHCKETMRKLKNQLAPDNRSPRLTSQEFSESVNRLYYEQKQRSAEIAATLNKKYIESTESPRVWRTPEVVAMYGASLHMSHKDEQTYVSALKALEGEEAQRERYEQYLAERRQGARHSSGAQSALGVVGRGPVRDTPPPAPSRAGSRKPPMSR